MKVPLLDLKAQYATIRNEVRAAIDQVCDEQAFILGPRVEQFERHVAEYSGSAHGIGVTSGSDALLVALMALDVGPGDAVVTSPYTFFATAGAVVRLGATPIFVDIDPVTFNIDPRRCRETLKKLPRAQRKLRLKVLMPVHLFGQVADMTPLMEIAAEHGMKVMEDAAQAIGAEYLHQGKARKAGSIGDIGCFSFFPSKNLGGFGDGGMIVTNDAALAEKMKILRNHGAKPKYYHKIVGGNFRLDSLQAAILEVKLKHLETWHQARRENAARYDKGFAGTDVKTPVAVYRNAGITNYHIYNQYVVRMAGRDALKDRLKTADIGCEVYYPVSLHMQECFKNLGYRPGDMPESEKAANETLALPIYPELKPDMQDHVVKTVAGKG